MEHSDSDLSDWSEYSIGESEEDEYELSYLELLLKFLWSIFGF